MYQLFAGFYSQMSGLEQVFLCIIFGVSFAALLYALYLRHQVLRYSTGTSKMQEVWNAVKQGADAYLTKQERAIRPVVGLLAVLMFLSVYVVAPFDEVAVRFPTLTDEGHKLVIGLGRMLSFLVAAYMSMTVGRKGMRMAIESSVRVAAAALEVKEADALKIAYRGATVTGMLTDGLGLLGGCIIFGIFGVAAPDVLIGFGFGGTLLALFMRVGGGIFTKAADVGGDLVGKIEAGIPEDDPRNPATIADNVGDNVGDCAGMAADIFESYEVSMVAAMILGIACMSHVTSDLAFVFFPLLVRAIGVVSSIVGTYLVRSNGASGNALGPIFRGFITSVIFSEVAFGVLAYVYLQNTMLGWWRPWAAVSVGIALVVVIHMVTEYYTASGGSPVREIVESFRTGPATGIITGASVGKESSFVNLMIISFAIYSAYQLLAPIGVTEGGRFSLGLYGVALMGIGMLTLTGNNVAMDSFGPITDNAQGIAEMSWGELDEKQTAFGRKLLSEYDAAGNCTKAVTKGVAISSAVIASVTLFGSYLVDVTKAQKLIGMAEQQVLGNTHIRLSLPHVFIGTCIGAALVYVFASFAAKAVSRAAMQIVLVVRKQIKNGVLEGKVRPDYEQPVAVATKAAQYELLPLISIAITPTIIVGALLGVEALGGFLGGAIISGVLMATFLNNTGGAWDNAKKTVESEERDPENGKGKGSERHKAAVICDTVGDPWKDTAGPALNPLLKVLNLVGVIVAPIMVQHTHMGLTPRLMILFALMAAFGVAFMRSKRGLEYSLDDGAQRND